MTETTGFDDVAVITGGASGLGRAIAEDCAARGRHVALLDRDGERAAVEATMLASTHAIDGRATVFCFRCQS